jgi:phage repressor protein C with HTH and peptisase S24 domain
MFRVFKIYGDSLYPLYKNGQRVLCLKISKRTSIDTNDTILFYNKNYGLMIKQIKKIENNLYYVEGTSPYSIDSRDFGALTLEEIQFKVLFSF